jgi:class 3 adenylate cyclase
MSVAAPPRPANPPEAAPEPQPAPRPTRSRRRARLGIQSKLLAMLLAVSVLAIVVAGFFGYQSGSRGLTASAYEQLNSVRDARTREVNALFAVLRRSALLNGLNATGTQSMTEFTRAFAELQTEKITPADQAAVDRYYERVFTPELAKNVQGEVDPASFAPSSNAQRYLQAKYTAPAGSSDRAVQVDDAGDGSTWSQVHAKYHDFFRAVVRETGLEDAMLVDTEGNVVYTAKKGVDLGTNLLTGPYKDSQLESAYREVLRANSVNAVAFTDFEPYTPAYEAPTAFALSPIGADGHLTGVLVTQMPVAAINDTMTSNGDWAGAGLGHTGEAYLVGPDQTMRSTSRQLLQDPQAFRAAVVAHGTPPAVADRIVATKNPILLQKISSGSVQAALHGQSGTVIEEDYQGRRVLTSYAPIVLPGVSWAVIVQVDEGEALGPVHAFLRTIGLTTLATVLAVTLLSMLLARAFSRPVSELVTGVRRVAGGDLDARVKLRGRDEFTDLADAFNDMGASLAAKQQLLDEERSEVDRMLRTLMPENVAKRYRGGERNIAAEHHDVSVLYATLDGFDELSVGRTPSEALALINELVRGFDTAADKTGVERVRTLRSGYIASCGLVVPRIDHVLRMLDFAREMVATVNRFSGQHGVDLRLRVGIDSGSVTSGLVGSSAAYDMWGESVTLAYNVQSAGDDVGIYVTDRIYSSGREAASFAEAGVISTKAGEQRVWRLTGSAA